MIEKIVRFTCDKCGKKKEVPLQDYCRLENNTGYKSIKFNGRYLIVCPECGKEFNSWFDDYANKTSVDTEDVEVTYIVGKYVEDMLDKHIEPYAEYRDFEMARNYANLQRQSFRTYLEIFKVEHTNTCVKYSIYKTCNFKEIATVYKAGDRND